MKVSSIQIVSNLQAKGFNALWAGGCVRDILLGKVPKDFDIVTDATPDQVEAMFDKTVAVGKAFGVIVVHQDGHEFEIATFRKESDYLDGRRPSNVEFTDDYDDAHRRDFTINGLFFDPLKDQIIDHISGQKDLDLGLVRFIGDPQQRILEDHLRILRAVRFKNSLDFQYHPDTYQALKKHASLISKISKERTASEINKILLCKNRVNALNDLEDLGLLELILPEVQAMKGVAQPSQYHKEGSVYEHTMLALSKMPEGLPLSYYWGILYHDSGKPETFGMNADRITFNGHAERSGELAVLRLKNLNYPKNFIKHVEFLCVYHMSLFQILDMTYKNQVKWFLKPWFLDLLEIHKYDTLGTEPSDTSMYDKLKDLYHEVVSNLPERLPKLVSGQDVMRIFEIQAGPRVAEILELAYDAQIEGHIKTEQEALDFLHTLKQADQ